PRRPGRQRGGPPDTAPGGGGPPRGGENGERRPRGPLAGRERRRAGTSLSLVQPHGGVTANDHRPARCRPGPGASVRRGRVPRTAHAPDGPGERGADAASATRRE